jgi:hypothetical protein
MAGTITETVSKLGNVQKITLTCVADAADGSFPSTAIAHKFSGRILQMDVNPGATAPTNLYDLVINSDVTGLDILQGLGANLLTATSEQKAIVFSSTEIHPAVDQSDTLTMVITNNSVNSAIIVINLYVTLGA